MLMAESTCGSGEKVETRDVAVLMEAVFAFVVRGARRIAHLPAEELETLKRLGIAYAHASDKQRGEIMETIVEMVLPDDFVGGVAEKQQPSKETVDKVESWRLKIGDAIRKAREEADLTQVELAKKARIPQSHVSRLERGMHSPTHITISKIAKALKVKPEHLDPGYCERV